MRSRSCNILHSCRVCFAATSGRSGVGISRCKHYLVLGFSCIYTGKLSGMKCAQGAFVLLNSLECAFWDGAIFERRGMVSVACDTLQSRLWLHAIWRILRAVMSLVSLFYKMSNVLHVTREWMVNKLTVKLIYICCEIVYECHGLLLFQVLPKAWVFIRNK